MLAGRLDKLGRTGGWQPRHFRLTPPFLQYFRTAEDAAAERGVAAIDLRLVTVVPDADVGSSGKLSLRPLAASPSAARAVPLRASNGLLALEWVQALCAAQEEFGVSSDLTPGDIGAALDAAAEAAQGVSGSLISGGYGAGGAGGDDGEEPPPAFGTFVKAVVRLRAGAKARRDREGAALRVMSAAQRSQLGALAVVYALFIFCRNYGSLVAPDLKEGPENLGVSNADFGLLSVGAGACAGVGKLVNGFLIDAGDEWTIYLRYMLATGALALCFSIAPSFQLLLAVSCANAFVQSAGWLASGKIIFRRFRPEQRGRAFSVMAVGSRGGSILTALSLGSLLGSFSWRATVRLAALAMVPAVLVMVALLRPSADEAEDREDSQVERNEAELSERVSGRSYSGSDRSSGRSSGRFSGRFSGRSGSGGSSGGASAAAAGVPVLLPHLERAATELAVIQQEDAELKRAHQQQQQQRKEAPRTAAAKALEDHLGPDGAMPAAPNAQLSRALSVDSADGRDSDSDDGDGGGGGGGGGAALAAKQQQGRSCDGARLICGWFRDARFSSIMVAQAAHFIVLTFESFVPLWLSDVLGVSSSTASSVAAALPAGILCSVIACGYFLETMKPRAKAATCATLAFGNVLVVFALLVATWVAEERGGCDGGNTGACVAVSAGLLFLSGLTVGYVYYIPASVFAVNFGGEDSAKVLAVFDMVASVFVVCFSIFGSGLADRLGWRYVMALLFCFSAAGFLALCLFFVLDLRAQGAAARAGRRPSTDDDGLRARLDSGSGVSIAAV